MTSDEKKDSKSGSGTVSTVLRYSGLGMQIALIIGGGAYLGKLLDEKYPMNKNWFTLGLVLLSVIIAMIYAVKTLNKMNK